MKAGIGLGRKKVQKPLPSAPLTTHMEINGNTEIVVEGCRGVMEYGSEAVRIRAGKQTVRFTGRGLEIKCLTADSLVVTGFLTGIEFLS